jgi:hypothetical protein
VTLKTCTRCKVEKPRDDFYKNASMPDGLASQCVPCLRQMRLTYYATYAARQVHGEQFASTKTCSRCKTPKPRNEFHGHAHHPDGLRSWCKSCRARRLPAAYRTVAPKPCSACNVVKPPDDFTKSIYNADGLSSYCRSCGRQRQKAFREAHPERTNASKLRSKYGITAEQYNAMLATQNGQCAICETTVSGRKRTVFYIDHNHSTRTVRGLLCMNCNTGLGMFQDSARVLENARNYLARTSI